MPQFRFHAAVSGIIRAPSIDDALTMVNEFVQVGNTLPAAIDAIDAEVHEAILQTALTQLDGAGEQLMLFTAPELCS